MRHFLDDIPRSEIEATINEWVLNERDREVLKRRLLDGVVFEKLCCEFDLSVRHTKRIVYKYEEKLFKKLNRH